MDFHKWYSTISNVLQVYLISIEVIWIDAHVETENTWYRKKHFYSTAGQDYALASWVLINNDNRTMKDVIHFIQQYHVWCSVSVLFRIEKCPCSANAIRLYVIKRIERWIEWKIISNRCLFPYKWRIEWFFNSFRFIKRGKMYWSQIAIVQC